MNRNWSKSTILYRCLAISVAVASVMVLAGRDDSSRRTSLTDNPALPSVAVDPAREFVVVLRPGDASDGAVSRSQSTEDIWQAALRSHDNPSLEARVQNLLRSVCRHDGPDPDDFDALMADTKVCLSVATYKSGGEKDMGFELAVETWATSAEVCDNPLCERFRAGGRDRGSVDRQDLDQSEPDIILH